MHNLLLNIPVLIFQEGNASKLGKQKRLYKLLTISVKLEIIDLLNGFAKFRITSIKPYYLFSDAKASNKKTLTPKHSDNISDNHTTIKKENFLEKLIYNILVPLVPKPDYRRLR